LKKKGSEERDVIKKTQRETQTVREKRKDQTWKSQGGTTRVVKKKGEEVSQKMTTN